MSSPWENVHHILRSQMPLGTDFAPILCIIFLYFSVLSRACNFKQDNHMVRICILRMDVLWTNWTNWQLDWLGYWFGKTPKSLRLTLSLKRHITLVVKWAAVVQLPTNPRDGNSTLGSSNPWSLSLNPRRLKDWPQEFSQWDWWSIHYYY